MKYIMLGSPCNQQPISRIGFGCMSLLPDFYQPLPGEVTENPLAVLEEAYKLGINFWDTADIYAFGENEKLISQLWKKIPRRDIVLSTKCGILRDKSNPAVRGVDNTEAYILNACEQSLLRLKTSYVDLFYLHRIDSKLPIEVPMHALKQLVMENKIRFIGLCEIDAETLRRAHRIHPIAAIQIEYSLLTRQPESELLPLCEELGIIIVAYSPISRGLLSGGIGQSLPFVSGDSRQSLPRFMPEHLMNNIAITQRIAEIAKRKMCSLPQLCLAYLLYKSDRIVPIPGTKSIAHLQSNRAALEVQLSKDDITALEELAPIGAASGLRYTASAMQTFGFKW